MTLPFRRKRITYSDVEYVEGIKRRDPRVERALYDLCRKYFAEHYGKLFFCGDDAREEIFENAFIQLWENIMDDNKTYVADGVLYGRDKQPWKGQLTSYMMSIAKNKYHEYVRSHPLHSCDTDHETDSEATQDKIDSIALEMLYGTHENAYAEIVRECISRMSERCRQILTMFYYDEMNLDAILTALPTFTNKNALKTFKYKCMETLSDQAIQMSKNYEY